VNKNLSILALLLACAVAAVAFEEAPMLAERVAAGELPPVDERLPDEPLVLTLERSAAPDGMLDELAIGTYGGDDSSDAKAPAPSEERLQWLIKELHDL
jgi:peptide/nickel transport system substrate-binding protein